MNKINTWEEAMDELADEKNALWQMLDNIVTLWEMEASMSDLESSMGRARDLLDNASWCSVPSTKEEVK